MYQNISTANCVSKQKLLECQILTEFELKNYFNPPWQNQLYLNKGQYTTMEGIEAFFKSCETGMGWDQCKKYCIPEATFECDVLPMKTLEDYTNWMKGLVTGIMPDARYQVISATHSTDTYVFCATFFGTHTLEGGPVPPSNPPKKTSCDYVYIIWFDKELRITKMRKIWDQLTAFKQLGWPIA